MDPTGRAMVKICTECHYVNAGGFRCSECEGRLIMVTDPEAQNLPDSVWKNQRVDYGARRGMIMRFMAIFWGSLTGLYLFRESVPLESPYNIVFGIVAIAIGLTVWKFLHWAAGRAVRVWVLAKGKVHKARLARAILISFLPWKRRGKRPLA
jgi:hypothetical protein